MFYLDVVEIVPAQHIGEPQVVRSIGRAPTQIEDLSAIDMPPKGAGVGVDEGLDDDFYGSESYNSDEFDPEGFEVSEDGR